MTEKFDRLAPGLSSKFNLMIDITILLLVIVACTGRGAHHMSEFIAGQALLAFFAVTGWLFAATVTRLYSPCTPRSVADNTVLIFMTVNFLTAGLFLVELTIDPDHNFFAATPFAAMVFGATTLLRITVFESLRRFDAPLDSVLIVGTSDLGIRTFEKMRALTGEKRRIIGFVRFEDEVDARSSSYAPLLGCTRDFEGIVYENPVSEVYIAGSVAERSGEMQEIVSHCERMGIPFALPVHTLKFERATLLSSENTQEDGYLHYLTAKPQPVGFAMKRLVDIAGAACGLIALSPMLLAVAAIIKLTSKGPVLYKQTRVGLHGSCFNLFKFRSMVTNADELKEKLMKYNEQTGPVFKMERDPRITSIGRFIRKYSIDELPQLVNILRGDMSVVGPRPAIPSEVAQYKAWHRRRLSVRPGLTCFWQVSGRNEIGFEDWMRLDLRYVDNWSLATDIKLIAKTVPVVVTGRGAS